MTWLTAAEAADRLGVKPATLYAYVSRGVLARRRSPSGQSLFDPVEVERLAARGRPRRKPGATDVVIESRITLLGEDRQFYRGHDALALALTASFESVAELLWTGEPPGGPPPLHETMPAGRPLWRPTAPGPAPLPGTAGPASGPAATAPWHGTTSPGGPAPLHGTAPTDRAAIRAGRSTGGPTAADYARDGTPPEMPARTRRSTGEPTAADYPRDGTPPEMPARTRRAPDDALPRTEARVWRASDEAMAAGQSAQSGLPIDVMPLERLQVVVPALATADPLRTNLDPDAVVDVARGLIAGMVDCLPGPVVDGSIADRLCAKLCPPGTARALTDVVRAAMVLIADHELAASTMAARVAASVRADPYAVTMTGLGATSGVLHGGASLGAEALLSEANGDPEYARAGLALRLRRGERIPGFGHTVYRGEDGRATTLLALLRATVGDEALRVGDAVIAEAQRRRVPAPNIDFALATLANAAGMRIGSGEALFGIARTAGWIAHALEEYANRTPIRYRAVYIGQS